MDTAVADQADNTLARVRTDVEALIGRRVGSIEPFGGGHSGFTYAVETGDDAHLVLRLSPPGARIAGPADVGRQGRIMSALYEAGLAVPRVIACSSQLAIDGRSFALM